MESVQTMPLISQTPKLNSITIIRRCAGRQREICYLSQIHDLADTFSLIPNDRETTGKIIAQLCRNEFRQPLIQIGCTAMLLIIKCMESCLLSIKNLVSESLRGVMKMEPIEPSTSLNHAAIHHRCYVTPVINSSFNTLRNIWI